MLISLYTFKPVQGSEKNRVRVRGMKSPCQETSRSIRSREACITPSNFLGATMDESEGCRKTRLASKWGKADRVAAGTKHTKTE